MTTCLRECKQLVPGNDGYCMENCQTACAAIEAKESAAGTAPFAPLSASTDIAGRAADDAPDVRGSSESIGIFGRESDSGVEKFAATLFGTRAPCGRLCSSARPARQVPPSGAAFGAQRACTHGAALLLTGPASPAPHTPHAGATKQASDPRVANRDEFVDEVVSSFKSGVMKSR